MRIRLFILMMFFFGAHLFLYFSAVRFFAVSAPGVKRLLFIGASFLSVSFMVSAILVRLNLNPVTGAFYAFSAFWTGLSINLMMASILLWLIALSARMARTGLSMSMAASALFAAAFLFSAYGVWNAFHPVIKNLDVEVKGLPEAWRNKTAVQISDVHLGAIHTPGYFRGIAKTINSLRPDVIFITGDLFDSINADGLGVFTGVLNELEAKDGIFFVNGNHEYYIGPVTVSSALAGTNIRDLRDEVVLIDGVQIIGADYPGFDSYRDVKRTIMSRKGFRKETPSILLYHTPTSIEQKKGGVNEQQRRTYWNPDLDFTAAKELGVRLQLSGHTHKGQFIPFTYLARFLYGGYDYGLKRDGDFFIYITSGLGTFGPPMRTGNTPEIVLIRLRPGREGPLSK